LSSPGRGTFLRIYDLAVSIRKAAVKSGQLAHPEPALTSDLVVSLGLLIHPMFSETKKSRTALPSTRDGGNYLISYIIP
jgi:hypothetical protein